MKLNPLPPGALARQLVWTVALAIATTGCGAPETAEPEASAPKPIVVRRVAVLETELVVPVFGTGTIAAHKSTEIGPRVDGIIEEIFVKVGDRMQAGDPLFQTRQVHYQIRLDEARQSLLLAEAELAHAKRERDRIESLHTSSVASEDRLDEVRTGHDIATARLGKVRAAHARALQELADTTVHAPFAGAITHRYVDEGVMMRTMMSGNSPVVQIMKMDIVAAIVQVPEVYLSQIHIGTPGRLKIDGIDRIIESEVYILNDLVDPVSRAFEIRLPITNKDFEIKPGLFAQAELLPESRRVTVVERGAVLGVEGNRYVFLKEGDTAVRRPIKARDLDAMRLEVIDGLSAGEYVLSGPNLRRLSPGTPVVVEGSHANR
jgi:RND family efflux transporter MFP subunit